MFKVLVTGAGGPAAVNFIRAISFSDKYNVIGTERNVYHRNFPNVKKLEIIPDAFDQNYIDKLQDVLHKNNIDFLHPQTSVEMRVISKNRNLLDIVTFLPKTEVVLRDKFEQQQVLEKKSIKTAKTDSVNSEQEFLEIKDVLSYPVWVRSKVGAGGRLSNKCNSPDEVLFWIKLAILQRKASWSDFIIQDYLSGRDIAFDSIWYNGKLIASYARERLEYYLSHLTPSGITGTPTVARIIHHKQANITAESAIKAIDEKPHGCYSVDMKEDDNGIPTITEVDSGKFHTTIGLWGFLAMNNLKLSENYSLPNLYLSLALEKHVPDMPQFDIYPEVTLVRNIDCGAWITNLKDLKMKVL